MTVKIKPRPLTGNVKAPTSKSAAHRALICAALSDFTELEISDFSNDIDATIDCLTAMGANIKKDGGIVSVRGIDFNKAASANININCRDSGSTLRFLLPLLSTGYFDKVTVDGEGRLPLRPITELCRTLTENGAKFNTDKLPLTMENSHLKSGKYKISGDISSQYISGLLFALPILEGDSDIILTSPLQSSSYVNMTLEMLSAFRIEILQNESGYFIKGGQEYISPRQLKVEGDWSNAAFFLAAGAIGEEITVNGLIANSSQGDKRIIEILKEYGAEVTENKSVISVKPNNRKAFAADVSEIPDLLPVLSVLGAYADGETKLYNAARLRMKESDRLKTTAEMLTAFGADVREFEDSLVIRGKGKLSSGTADSFNDHRIAMSAAIGAIGANGIITITDAGAVRKSYPEFFSVYKTLGGEVNVVDDRQQY